MADRLLLAAPPVVAPRLHFGHHAVATHGAIAQLGERLDRTQEVGGSSPPSSIPKPAANRRVFVLSAEPAGGGAESAVKFWSSSPPDRCPFARGAVPALKRARAGADYDVAAVLFGLQ
jgi:hypothetical protein